MHGQKIAFNKRDCLSTWTEKISFLLFDGLQSARYLLDDCFNVNNAI